MPRTISAQLLMSCWQHSLFIHYFQQMYGDEEVLLTRDVLLRMRFDKGINLDMWFRAQFPKLNAQYVALTQSIREQYWAERKNLERRDPRVNHRHRDFMPQYHRARAFLEPLEEARDRKCIEVIAQILELPN